MLPLALRSVLESGNGVLFLGAGIGHCAFNSAGDHMPDAAALAAGLAGVFSIDTGGSSDLAKVAEIVELRKGRPELTAFLSTRLDGYDPDDSLRWLFGLTWKAIFTTNYDRVIERTYELAARPSQTPVSISSTAELVTLDPRFQVPVYHVHGALFGVPSPHILITQRDYALFRERRRMLFELLKQQMATCPILYIGYANTDPNWHTVLAELRAEFAPSALPHSFRIAPSTDPLDVEILRSQGIATLDMDLSQFAQQAQHELGSIRIDPSKLSTYRSQVPPDLTQAFENNPASTLRLLASWAYVNQAPFGEPPNTQRFLAGDAPNWALIEQALHFRRDIEETLMDPLLDYATASSGRSESLLLLGPAGFGITTTLMSTAVRLVREQAGPVFMHKPGTSVTEGDIAFACSILTSRVYIVVDNASEYMRTIQAVAMTAKRNRQPVCFILGERRNEWRQGRHVFKPKEFEVGPLSEDEIVRLLECLHRHSALGVLKELSPDLQKAAIREKHGRQLLVAMREVTEGKAFDAIIEDEYLHLRDELARRVYAAVSCVYKLRHYLRDQVLSEMVQVPLSELYRDTRDATDGVIDYDCIDAGAGIYGAKCRHHTIAEIVWERCVSDADKPGILLRLLDALNLNYLCDSKFFDELIRSDRQVDSLGSLEAKVQFFEDACKKDPQSPYVRQHYARMLLREMQVELALSQIEAAIRMGQHDRILHHTKGVILRDMAIATPSVELARRRLAQSEMEFRDNIRSDKRDSYSYQSLAELYLMWAKRAVKEDEAASYVAKAEAVISEGLKMVHNREGLYIVSAQVSQFVGEGPKAIEMLRKATNSTIGKYLLARAYIRAEDLLRARPILEQTMKEDPTDPRIAMLYADLLVRAGEPYAKAIAVLQLARLYGMRSSRFIATLGGMLLMNGDFSGAASVFNETPVRRFPIEEEQRIQYRPRPPGEPKAWFRLTGEIVSAKSGYAWIRVSGYPDVFCSGAALRRIDARPGKRIDFQLCFNARGAVADDVNEA